MKILLLAPTNIELASLQFEHEQLTKKVSGIGATELTSCVYSNVFEQTYDQIILVGLAGGVEKETQLTKVYQVVEDIQGDLGVFEKKQFIPFETIGLINPTKKNQQYNLTDKIDLSIAKCNSLSTNILFDEKDKNDQRHLYYKTTIENMEGAAFQTSCERLGIPHLQLRAISNFIGERNKNKWKIKEALAELDRITTDYLKTVLCD